MLIFMKKSFLKEFESPPNQYRGMPLWLWNGKLDPDELRRQMRLLRDMGMGGIQQFTGNGLDTVYLSDDWMACIEACLEEAEKLDMQVWLYDEDRWPSGYAGGLVTRNPNYRRRSLVLLEITDARRLSWGKDVLAAFTAKIDGTSATGVRRLARGKRPKRLAKDERILVFVVEVDAPGTNYNGQTYVDTMNRDALAKFIELTHDAYRKRLGAHFGKRLRGFFTDEPTHGKISVARDDGTTATAWTDKLPAIFRKRYGYDLVARLPELFFDLAGQEVSAARYHYHDCITHLFVDAFARQLGEWCVKNGTQLSGHAAISVGTLGVQTREIGSYLRFLEHQQVPSMDILTEYRRSYDTAKLVSSAARQFGRKWRLSETYGCVGWAFPFAGHKAVCDWQAAMGINMRAVHLAWYTMEGKAKRDYPQCISYQSAWWPYYRKVEDYFGRVNAVMSRGQDVRDLLVIHANESMWTLFNRNGENDAGVIACDRMFGALRDSLLVENIDFDYGDEDILARHGKTGKAGGTTVLRVAKATYRAVLVPPLRTMRSTTLALLEQFHEAGGTVVFAGAPASCVDALPSQAPAALARCCRTAPAQGKALVRAVESQSRRLHIVGPSGRAIRPALHLLKEDRAAFYLFVCNTGHDFSKRGPENDIAVRRRTASFDDVRIRGFAGCAGAPIELDPDSGEVYRAVAERDDHGWEIRTSLPRLGSRIFVIPKRAERDRHPVRRQLEDVRRRGLGKDGWNIILSEKNGLVLDRPRFKVGSGRWRTAPDILRVDDAVRDVLGLAYRRDEFMVQPYARQRDARPRCVDVALDYSFNVQTVTSGDLFLGLERPETFRISLNGTPVSVDAECGWWCDRSLRTVPLDPGLLRLGTNRIKLRCDYDENHSGLEMAYLLGTFGVQIDGAEVTMTALPRQLRIGDWCGQGLPFYSGSVSYVKTVRPKLAAGQRLFVQVPGYAGMGVCVRVGGREAGIIGWEPNEVDITDFVNDDPIELQLQVIGHRRNSHGPLHLSDSSPIVTGPDEFVSEGDRWVDSYQLAPCGLISEPHLVVRR